MDAENDNDQPNSLSAGSSSTNSSNNSSSSNLLINLPLLLNARDDDDDADDDDVDDDVGGLGMDRNNGHQHHAVEAMDIALQPPLPHPGDEFPLPLPPPSPAPAEAAPPPLPPLPQQQHAIAHPLDAADSVFISPLLFNNNNNTNTATLLPTPSSTSSTTSSSSTQPPQHDHVHHLLHQEHSSEHHTHHEHFPPSPSHQQHASHVIEQQQQQQSAQPQQLNAIADTIDASTVEAASAYDDASAAPPTPAANAANNVNAAAVPSTSQQQHQQQQSLSGNITDTGAGRSPPPSQQQQQQRQQQPTPPRTLPLLLQQQQQEARGERTPPQQPLHNIHPFTHATHYHRHTHHEHQHHHHEHQPQHYNHPFLDFGSGCSNLYGFNAPKGNSGGDATNSNMFTNNDSHTAGSGSGHTHHAPGTGGHHHNNQQMGDRLKLLYPNVNENETALPRCWSPQDKCQSIMLSQNNLRIHYKGTGKPHNDAASVRTAYPIPPACGLYYFEVKIISKGKNGYMGIGLTAQQFRMNRLPGWDKQSYGYHGDDGNSFSSSGNGQSYGPTFTTGDVIGCCVNFVNNTCFYTKNGIDLGIAFRDLPTKLYPTVGLQTPGEEVDANFGQEPFQFDQIEDMMKQMRAEMKTAIYDFPMPVEQGDQTTLLHKMVSTYLVHNGYSQTAEAFARYTGQTFKEDLTSVRNRQKILKLVISGKMGQAIECTLRLYPGLLENNKNLWFMLKCRQFIEMINGSDIECCSINNKIINNSPTTTTTNTQTQTTPPNQTSVIQSTKSYQNGKTFSNTTANANATTTLPITTTTTTTTSTTTSTTTPTNSAVIHTDNHNNEADLKNAPATRENSDGSGDGPDDSSWNNGKNKDILAANLDYLNDVEMENNGHFTNGNSCNKNGSNFNNSLDVDEDMDIDIQPSRKYSHDERILQFGRELSQMGQLLENENKMKDEDRQMLDDAFSLMAYTNPWSSPLGWQLCPTKRETVCTALNSAMLESMNYPRRPPLDVCVAHASELLKLMAQASLGACAFVNIDDIFSQN